MKRLIAMVAVLALVAGMATAAPSFYGSNGLFRTIGAQNAGPMNFGIGVHGVVYGYMNDSSATTAKTLYYRADLPIEGYFSINDMFELSVAPVYHMEHYKATFGTVTVKSDLNGLLDTRAGLKFSYKLSDNFIGGVYVGYDIPTISDTLNPYHASTVYKHNGALDARLLADYKFGAGALNLNAGVAYNLDKYEVGGVNYVYPNMAIPFSIGFSYKVAFVTPFVDLSMQLVPDTTKYAKAYTVGGGTNSRGLLNNPTWAGAGLRFGFGALNVDLGGEYNIQTKDSTLGALNRSESWNAIIGVSYAPVKEAGPKVPATGIIAGKVTDSKGKPLAATISVAGMTFNADPATGNFTAPGLQITGAPVEVKADLKGYISKTGSVVLTKKNKKTPATQDFVLELKPIPMGTVKGTVKDMGGAPVDGNVAFGATIVAVKQGAFSASLPAGDYNGVFQIPGYFEKTVSVKVTDKGTTPVDAKLLKKGTAMDVAVVWKLAGNAIVKSFSAGNIVTAAKDNPKAKIMVIAYVDRVGGAKLNQKLADNRANTVKAELIKAGVAGEIMTKGVVVLPTGKTKADKAANTKVVVTLE